MPLRDWLASLHLEAYAPILRALQCTELARLAKMDDGQVVNLINLAKMKEQHAAKFFRNVQRLRSANANANANANADANVDTAADAMKSMYGRQRVAHLRQVKQGALVDVLMDEGELGRALFQTHFAFNLM